MAGKIDLRRGFQATLDQGREIGPYPTVATAVLLTVLARSGGPVSRKSLAATIYPHLPKSQAANALRQTIHRLKTWIGTGELISQKSMLRLAGEWIIVYPGMSASESGGIDHPYFASLQPAATDPPAESESSTFDYLRRIAGDDPEIAREVLIASLPLLEKCTRAQVAQLVGALRPRRATEHLAGELLLAASLQHFRFADFKRSIADSERAFRIARHRKNRGLQAEASAFLLFYHLETGNIADAERWLSTLRGFDKISATKLLSANAETAFFWNMDDRANALAQIEKGRAQVRKASRRARLHFASNAALCLAEFGDLARSAEMAEEAKSLLIPGLDIWHGQVICLADAEAALRSERPEDALTCLKECRDLAVAHTYPVNLMYAVSVEARILAKLGRQDDAEAAWEAMETERFSAGGGLNPRLAAQRQQIFAAE